MLRVKAGLDECLIARLTSNKNEAAYMNGLGNYFY